MIMPKVRSFVGRGSYSHRPQRAANDLWVIVSVPGAISLPPESWDSLVGLSRDQTNIIYCYTMTCHLAVLAALRFASAGFPVMEMEGGIEAWREYGYEVEPSGERPEIASQVQKKEVA